jgi:sigma-E factor negative regulatory protein RseA
MEKISQLIDGDLGQWEARAQIARLERDPQLADCWATYHLIGDALRKEIDLGPEFTRKLRAQLESEPAILAPRVRLIQHTARHALPIAAAVAGVTVVAWLAFQAPSNGPEIAAGPSPANAGVADYLVAHQEFSPSTTMHGVASYMRTVSADESNGAR